MVSETHRPAPKTLGTDTTEYTYDALGNLTRVELPNGTVIGYLLDAMNRRIGKTVNDTLVRAWLYQGQLTPVAELDGSGTVVSRFVYATGVNVPDYLVRGDSTYRIIRDHLGSVRLVVNVASGTIAQRVSYDEFGIETENTNPGWQPFGYAGGLTDSQTGLVRFGARDYDPVAGRWTAKDPIGFAGGATSLYEYAANDPIGFADPSGLLAASALFCLLDLAANEVVNKLPPVGAVRAALDLVGISNEFTPISGIANWIQTGEFDFSQFASFGDFNGPDILTTPGAGHSVGSTYYALESRRLGGEKLKRQIQDRLRSKILRPVSAKDKKRLKQRVKDIDASRVFSGALQKLGDQFDLLSTIRESYDCIKGCTK